MVRGMLASGALRAVRHAAIAAATAATLAACGGSDRDLIPPAPGPDSSMGTEGDEAAAPAPEAEAGTVPEASPDAAAMAEGASAPDEGGEGPEAAPDAEGNDASEAEATPMAETGASESGVPETGSAETGASEAGVPETSAAESGAPEAGADVDVGGDAPVDSASSDASEASEAGNANDASDANDANDASDVGAASDANDSGACNQVLADGYAACNQICNAGPVVDILNTTTAPPAPAGGTPLPGLYYLTAVTHYYAADAGVASGSSGSTLQQTVMLTAADPVGLDQAVQSSNGGPNDTSSFQYFVSGTELYVQGTCPTAQQFSTGYTVSGNQLIVFLPPFNSSVGYEVEERVFTLQQPGEAGAPPSDAGSGDAGTCSQPLTDALAACNSLCNTATSVPVVHVAGSAPAATGGTLVDGTYYLTAKNHYDGSDAGADAGPAYSVAETLVIATDNGVTTFQIVESNGGAANVTESVLAYGSGTQLYVTLLCPSAQQAEFFYTASGNVLRIYQADHGGIDESVLTKQ